MTQANVATIQGLYKAFDREDTSTVLAVLDPTVDWNETEGFPYSGKFVGPDAVLHGVLKRLGTEWDEWRAIPDEMLDSADRGVVLGWYSGTNKATGKSFRARFADVWTLGTARSCTCSSTLTRRRSTRRLHTKRDSARTRLAPIFEPHRRKGTIALAPGASGSCRK